MQIKANSSLSILSFYLFIFILYFKEHRNSRGPGWVKVYRGYSWQEQISRSTNLQPFDGDVVLEASVMYPGCGWVVPYLCCQSQAETAQRKKNSKETPPHPPHNKNNLTHTYCRSMSHVFSALKMSKNMTPSENQIDFTWNVPLMLHGNRNGKFSLFLFFQKRKRGLGASVLAGCPPCPGKAVREDGGRP